MIAIRAEAIAKRFVKSRNNRVPVFSAAKAKLTGTYGNRFFWALQDINFEIQKGERVAVLGRNGAGKTTLLRLISGAMLPSRGELEVNGRIAPLFGVGTGFHNDLTGRENLLLAGAMFGMQEKDVVKLMPGILEFADIGHFIDSPVKHYSSGMKARLGFALADCLDADIMLLDEILSVGDKDFRAKSQQRIQEKIAGGQTVILVTHNVGAAVENCDRGLVIEDGRISFDGPIEAAAAHYQQLPTNRT